MFGVQAYIVKGVRKSSKKKQPATAYFQPAAILDLEVYHNQVKNLQYIKEYQWAVLYERIFFDVTRNAAAQYMVELLLNSQKQPESNTALFDITAEALQHLDRNTENIGANIPLYYTIKLCEELGFGVQGTYTTQTPVLDLEAGIFTTEQPLHAHYLANEAAQAVAQLNETASIENLGSILLNRNMRRLLLQALQNYIRLHITDFRELKTLAVLMEIF